MKGVSVLIATLFFGAYGACGGEPSAPPLPECEHCIGSLVVLGDSVGACTGAGGRDAPNCAARLFQGWLESRQDSAVAYHNLAIEGARARDVVEVELAKVTSARRHTIVIVNVGGNDLQPLLHAPAAQLQSRFAALMNEFPNHWQAIADRFSNQVQFPEGTTLLFNGLYDPFDACSQPPHNAEADRLELIRTYNLRLKRWLASQSNAHFIEVYDAFLGHANMYNVAGCPHYSPNATPWMFDLFHPNELGYAKINMLWRETLFGPAG